MVQIATLLMVADAGVIWYAFTGAGPKLWQIWTIGSLLAFAAISVVLRTAHLMKPVMYTAVSIEQTDPPSVGAPYDGLVSMFVSTTYWRRNYIKNLENVASEQDPNARRASLIKLGPPYSFGTFMLTPTGIALLLRYC
jgi:hypothetical protein